MHTIDAGVAVESGQFPGAEAKGCRVRGARRPSHRPSLFSLETSSAVAAPSIEAAVCPRSPSHGCGRLRRDAADARLGRRPSLKRSLWLACGLGGGWVVRSGSARFRGVAV